MHKHYVVEKRDFIAPSVRGSTRRESQRDALPQLQCGEIVATAFIAHS
jgi:hypothetical protein